MKEVEFLIGIVVLIVGFLLGAQVMYWISNK
jgi:membrane protein DedA with SNARE-associated domain